MLPAVDLDHQPLLEASKVNDVRTDRDLATESCSEGPAPKLPPDSTLGVGHVLPQIPGVTGAFVVDHGTERVAGFLEEGNIVVAGAPPS